jgi:hypothetical protein
VRDRSSKAVASEISSCVVSVNSRSIAGPEKEAVFGQLPFREGSGSSKTETSTVIALDPLEAGGACASANINFIRANLMRSRPGAKQSFRWMCIEGKDHTRYICVNQNAHAVLYLHNKSC